MKNWLQKLVSRNSSASVCGSTGSSQEPTWPLPARLTSVMERGIWPRDYSQEMSQNTRPLFPVERIQLIAPNEDTVYFHRPPFVTLAQEIGDDQNWFWRQYGALEQIDPKCCLVIGDFGLGSDSPIVLDFRSDAASPRVLRLEWKEVGRGMMVTNWVEIAATFDELADTLGLGGTP